MSSQSMVSKPSAGGARSATLPTRTAGMPQAATVVAIDPGTPYAASNAPPAAKKAMGGAGSSATLPAAREGVRRLYQCSRH